MTADFDEPAPTKHLFKELKRFLILKSESFQQNRNSSFRREKGSYKTEHRSSPKSIYM